MFNNFERGMSQPESDPVGTRRKTNYVGADRSDPEGFQRSKEYVLGREKIMDESLAKLNALKTEWSAAFDEYKKVCAGIDAYTEDQVKLIEDIKLNFPKVPDTEEGQKLLRRRLDSNKKYDEILTKLNEYRDLLDEKIENFSEIGAVVSKELNTVIAEMVGGIPENN